MGDLSAWSTGNALALSGTAALGASAAFFFCSIPLRPVGQDQKQNEGGLKVLNLCASTTEAGNSAGSARCRQKCSQRAEPGDASST